MIANKEKPNIIIVVADTLRAKNMSCYGYPKETAPFLCGLANEGVFFKNAYTTIPATDPALTSLFTGYYPATHGIFNHGFKVSNKELSHFMRTGIKMLPEILSNIGYQTFAIDWLGRWHRRGYMYYFSSIYNSRENEFINSLSYLINKMPSLIRKNLKKIYYTIKPPRHILSADDITEIAIRIIENNTDNQLFLFIHYWDTHNPYNPGKVNYKLFTENIDDLLSEIVRNFNPRDKEFLLSAYGNKSIGEIVGMYNAAIRNIDENIRKIYKTLVKHGLWKNTIFIFTGDHGESLYEHGIYFDHHSLYNEVLHVPMIMIYPELIPKGKIIYNDVQHVDIVPTLLNTLGFDIKGYFDGISLLEYITGEKDFPQLRILLFEEHEHEERAGIKIGKYKYITFFSKKYMTCKRCRTIHGYFEELYDLNNDRAELNNLIFKRPDLGKELRHLLLTYRDTKIRKSLKLISKNTIRRFING